MRVVMAMMKHETNTHETKKHETILCWDMCERTVVWNRDLEDGYIDRKQIGLCKVVSIIL